MKLDLDLAARILQAMEDHPLARPGDDPEFVAGFIHKEKISKETFGYHVGLLGDAGFVRTQVVSGRSYPIRMTWGGHLWLIDNRPQTQTGPYNCL